MKTIIVYDSFFDNTRNIALAISKAFSPKEIIVKKVDPSNTSELKNFDLIIIGSPTRAFRPSPNIKDYLNKIPRFDGKIVAAFDTRMSVADTNSRFLRTMAKMFGYAADPIAKTIKRKGGKLIIAPEGFFVKDTKGPLKEGELKRAEDWGKRIRTLLQ